MIPVFVPSYQRPDATFLKRSVNYDFPMYVFVRTEEAGNYAWLKNRYATHLVYIHHVHNIGDTRRLMIKYAIYKGFDKIFMIDDDICRLDISLWDENKQVVRASGTVKGKPEDWRKSLHVWEKAWGDEAMFGASYRPFSWSMKKEQLGKSSRAQLQQAVGINVKAITDAGLNYKSNTVVGNEDLFLQLECYKHGLECVRTSLVQYDCPSMGEGTGGCNASESGTIQEKQAVRVKAFLNSCSEEDKKLIRVGKTRSGVESIKFVWKEIAKLMGD